MPDDLEKEIAVAERKAESMLKELEKIEGTKAIAPIVYASTTPTERYTSGELFGAAVPSDIKKIFDKPEEKTFCQLLKEAIEDEDKAPSFYEQLKQKSEEGTRIPILSFVIDSIKRDEEKHKELLEKIKTVTCD